MNENSQIEEALVRALKLGFQGRIQELRAYARRIARNIREDNPSLSRAIKKAATIKVQPGSNSLRSAKSTFPSPVDLDSRFNLIRIEDDVELKFSPILEPETSTAINRILAERKSIKQFEKAGVPLSKSILFVGPPGVGKTFSARMVANRLNIPLLILDLSAVMSSFLGRTGNNIKAVLDYAKSIDCVLLLDEIDSIAKRRDDATEIGELKRLVTVLLQEIDNWPQRSILIAATNHPDLLDPAIWRRFDQIVNFNKPDIKSLAEFSKLLIDGPVEKISLIGALLAGSSYSEAERIIQIERREQILNGGDICDNLIASLCSRIKSLPGKRRTKIALQMVQSGLTQRRANELTGVSRDTIRAHAKRKAPQ